jgi:hypothetical protein
LELPVRISKVMQAKEPLLATAKGAYMMAAAEDES